MPIQLAILASAAMHKRNESTVSRGAVQICVYVWVCTVRWSHVDESRTKEFTERPSSSGEHGQTSVLDFGFTVIDEVSLGLGKAQRIETNVTD